MKIASFGNIVNRSCKFIRKMCALRYLHSNVVLYIFYIYVSGSNECKMDKKCMITCSGDFTEAWSNQIKDLAVKNQCNNIELRVTNGKFPFKTLSHDWLDDVGKTDAIMITTLKFIACDFEIIEAGALTLKGLKHLHLSRGSITVFKRDFFSNLPDLKEFVLQQFNEEIRAESRLLENAKNVETLQIENCNFDGRFIGNITGQDGSSTKIQILAITHNNIKYLPELMVMKAKDLRSLFLYNNGIEQISQKAFWGIINIQQIFLNNNDLTTLENGTFDYIRSNEWGNRTIKLDNNPWKCDCHLKWLQDLYKSPEIVLIQDTPLCDDSISFDDAKFVCDDDNTTKPSISTPSTSSISSTSSTSTTVPIDLITLECKDGMEFENLVVPSGTREFLRRFFITIKPGSNKLVRVDIYDLDGSPELEIVFAGLPSDASLVYFEMFKSKYPVCIANINKVVYLCELRRNRTYTFCLLGKDEVTVAPTNCFGLQVPPDWEDRAWITNMHQILIISSVVGGLMLCVAITIITSYYIIKSYPKLIAGNKDVIILQHDRLSCRQPTIEGQNYDRPDYAEPTHEQSGYMTPAYSRYDKINYYNRHVNSPNSIYGARSNSYIHPGYNTEYCTRNLTRIDKNITNFAVSKPPLPKPNKTKDKIYY